MDMFLRIRSDKMGDEDLQALILKLCGALNAESDITASLPVSEVKNAKGTLIELGALVLSFIGTDAGKVLTGFIEKLLLRESHLELEITRTDGSALKISARNKSQKEIVDILSQLQ